jgi:hypothetical protein
VRAADLSLTVPGSGPGTRNPMPGGREAINGSGIRDTARVLRISPTTVIAVLKKSPRASTRQRRLGTTPLVRTTATSASRQDAQPK